MATPSHLAFSRAASPQRQPLRNNALSASEAISDACLPYVCYVLQVAPKHQDRSQAPSPSLLRYMYHFRPSLSQCAIEELPKWTCFACQLQCCSLAVSLGNQKTVSGAGSLQACLQASALHPSGKVGQWLGHAASGFEQDSSFCRACRSMSAPAMTSLRMTSASDPSNPPSLRHPPSEWPAPQASLTALELCRAWKRTSMSRTSTRCALLCMLRKQASGRLLTRLDGVSLVWMRTRCGGGPGATAAAALELHACYVAPSAGAACSLCCEYPCIMAGAPLPNAESGCLWPLQRVTCGSGPAADVCICSGQDLGPAFSQANDWRAGRAAGLPAQPFPGAC